MVWPLRSGAPLTAGLDTHAGGPMGAALDRPKFPCDGPECSRIAVFVDAGGSPIPRRRRALGDLPCTMPGHIRGHCPTGCLPWHAAQHAVCARMQVPSAAGGRLCLSGSLPDLGTASLQQQQWRFDPDTVARPFAGSPRSAVAYRRRRRTPRVPACAYVHTCGAVAKPSAPADGKCRFCESSCQASSSGAGVCLWSSASQFAGRCFAREHVAQSCVPKSQPAWGLRDIACLSGPTGGPFIRLLWESLQTNDGLLHLFVCAVMQWASDEEETNERL